MSSGGGAGGGVGGGVKPGKGIGPSVLVSELAVVVPDDGAGGAALGGRYWRRIGKVVFRLGMKPGMTVEIPGRAGVEELRDRVRGALGTSAVSAGLSSLGCTGLWLTLDRMNRKKGAVDVLEILWADGREVTWTEGGVGVLATDLLPDLDRLIWQTVVMETTAWHMEHYSGAGRVLDGLDELSGAGEGDGL